MTNIGIKHWKFIESSASPSVLRIVGIMTKKSSIVQWPVCKTKAFRNFNWIQCLLFWRALNTIANVLNILARYLIQGAFKIFFFLDISPAIIHNKLDWMVRSTLSCSDELLLKNECTNRSFLFALWLNRQNWPVSVLYTHSSRPLYHVKLWYLTMHNASYKLICRIQCEHSSQKRL